MDRRGFLTATGAAALAAACNRTPKASKLSRDDRSWEGVRAAFRLSPDSIHMAGLLLASHPKPVRDAIEKYRNELDENPVEAVHHVQMRDKNTFARAAAYLQTDPAQIALTDSTTMGLGLIYSGLKLNAGDEVVTTAHGHYSTRESLRYQAERTGAKVRVIDLYPPHDASGVTVDGIVGKLTGAITKETRVVAVTWVHSCSGLKMPLRAISDALEKLNTARGPKEQILFCVDGVHGFGVDNIVMSDINVDFFIAGTHKWLFGPRGTGMIWGSDRGWSAVESAIPPFDWGAFNAWVAGKPPNVGPGQMLTPGGFHSFEHRWALSEAFDYHMDLGKDRVQSRIHALATQAKRGLKGMSGVKLMTPMEPALSAGIVCFDVQGKKPRDVIGVLKENKVIGSTSPYAQSYARVTPALFNTEQEVDTTLAAIRKAT
jgi:isopenicillin-N epimerase